MNTALRRAKQEKNDEYYTLLEDIENELSHYPTRIFKNAHVHLPCDDPAKSKFFTYFTQNFNRLQLAKLTAIHYTPRIRQLPPSRQLRPPQTNPRRLHGTNRRPNHLPTPPQPQPIQNNRLQ